jgi:mannose-1-phosphate guanylyltransferase
MTQSLIPVILAGGKGERFWPLSRKNRPKQFLSLDGTGQSLLQSAAFRLLDLAGGWDRLWVITSELIADGVREQLPLLPESNILVEPIGKDTAPAVAWATLEIKKTYGQESVIGFFPADHWIGDQSHFEATIKAATQLASTEKAIVTLGIKPSYPSTGYGYIEQGEIKGNFEHLPVYKVSRFTEKPDRETAESFIKTGLYSWNSGMFIFRADLVLSELNQYVPQMLLALEKEGKNAYFDLEKISIDYALMEKTKLAYVLPANFGWDDLGDWNALERLRKGKSDNVELGRHIGKDTHNSIIYNSHQDEVIVTIGLDDLVIVRDGNTTLVIKKDCTQDLKQILKQFQDDSELEGFL